MTNINKFLFKKLVVFFSIPLRFVTRIFVIRYIPVYFYLAFKSCIYLFHHIFYNWYNEPNYMFSKEIACLFALDLKFKMNQKFFLFKKYLLNKAQSILTLVVQWISRLIFLHIKHSSPILKCHGDYFITYNWFPTDTRTLLPIYSLAIRLSHCVIISYINN